MWNSLKKVMKTKVRKNIRADYLINDISYSYTPAVDRYLLRKSFFLQISWNFYCMIDLIRTLYNTWKIHFPKGSPKLCKFIMTSQFVIKRNWFFFWKNLLCCESTARTQIFYHDELRNKSVCKNCVYLHYSQPEFTVC